MFIWLKIYTDSDAPVNLKNNVSIIMQAAMMRQTQLVMICLRLSVSAGEQAIERTRAEADGDGL